MLKDQKLSCVNIIYLQSVNNIVSARTKGRAYLKKYWKCYLKAVKDTCFHEQFFLVQASCQVSWHYDKSSDAYMRFVVSCYRQLPRSSCYKLQSCITYIIFYWISLWSVNENEASCFSLDWYSIPRRFKSNWGQRRKLLYLGKLYRRGIRQVRTL